MALHYIGAIGIMGNFLHVPHFMNKRRDSVEIRAHLHGRASPANYDPCT